MSELLTKIKKAITQQGLQASIDSSRVIISTQYDIDYQITIVGLIFCNYKLRRTRASRSILRLNRMLLRLLHFLVLRPDLISEFKYWCMDNAHEKVPSLDDWTSFPRGFLSDSAQADTISLLIIRHELIESGKDLILDTEVRSRINRLTEMAMRLNLFKNELNSIRELSILDLKLASLGF